MKKYIVRRSKAAGFQKSLLPKFTAKAKRLLKGSVDFLGINIYSAYITRTVRNQTDSLSWKDCSEVEIYQLPSWKPTVSALFKVGDGIDDVKFIWLNDFFTLFS